MHPFIPFAADRLRAMLHLDPIGPGDLLTIQNRLAEGDVILQSGHPLGRSSHLFSKIEDEKIQMEIEKLKNKSTSDTAKSKDNHAFKKDISFEDFVKIDLRVGKILKANRVPKTDKLMELLLDLSSEQRTVVSGIAHQYDPDELIGKQVTVVCNLSARKIRGIRSQGMILMAENEDGTLQFISPSSEIQTGSRVS